MPVKIEKKIEVLAHKSDCFACEAMIGYALLGLFEAIPQGVADHTGVAQSPAKRSPPSIQGVQVNLAIALKLKGFGFRCWAFGSQSHRKPNAESQIPNSAYQTSLQPAKIHFHSFYT
ncbi:MAG: hypothetical protein ACI8X3_001251 [Saprospiraceae bacterium]